jgi:hypothetical protein
LLKYDWLMREVDTTTLGLLLLIACLVAITSAAVSASLTPLDWW